MDNLSNVSPTILRMFGGVAGARDQCDSNELVKLPNGEMGYAPSRRYMNDILNRAQSLIPHQQLPPSPYPVRIEKAEPKEDSMDISKYIGKEKKPEKQPVPNSQLELLKVALNPLSDQLEKVCILLGLIYQELGKFREEEALEESTVVSAPNMEMTITPEEQTAALEQQLDSMSKTPRTSSTEELGEMNSLDID